jgi:hypothetical protein
MLVLTLRSLEYDLNDTERRMLREEAPTIMTTQDVQPDDQDESSSLMEVSASEIEESQTMNRLLVEGIEGEIQDMTAVPEYDVLQNAVDDNPNEASSVSANSNYDALIASSHPLPQYTLSSLLSQIAHYSHTFAILIYDPAADEFYALYSKKHHWASANEKMIKALSSITYFIRTLFPEKLKEELAIGISSGDYPAVKITDCVKAQSGVARRLKREGSGGCAGEEAPPILHFGSTFRQDVFPNMIS